MASINYLTLRPEQAYKIYDDYVKEGKNNDALLILFRYLSSFGQRTRKTTTSYQDQGDVSVASNIQYLYKLMQAYIDLRLFVGVNQPDEQNQLKEVFKAYRQMTQHNHFDAFADILKEYLVKVEKIFSDKVKQYDVEELKKLPFVGQLSYEEPAEELLYLSFDPEAKQQKDHQKSCLRLLWETYRTVMENVKWNEKLEDVYFEILKKVSEFCLKYKRKAEFQWFCDQTNRFVLDLNERELDIKRNPTHVDLTKPATNDKHVNAIFEIVKTAMALDMQSEASKTLETVMVLKSMRRGNFKASYLMLYYDLLSQIFQKSGNSLFQAFAYYNHYLAFKKKPVQTQEEIKRKNAEINEKLSHLVLSVLVIPLLSADFNQRDRTTSLFEKGTKIPSREDLLKILGEMNAVKFVQPIIQKVYLLLENQQDLLTVSDQANRVFTELRQNEKYLLFIPLLEENLVGQVLKSISRIYRTIKLDQLKDLLKFTNSETIFQTLIYSNSNKFISCKVDFQSQIVSFNSNQISNDQQILPTVLLNLQPQRTVQDPIEQAKKQLDSSNLVILTRQQTLKNLNRLADPDLIKKKVEEDNQKVIQEMKEQRRQDEERKKFEQERIAEMEAKKAKEISIRQKLLQDIIKLKGGKYVTFEINGERKKIELLKDYHLLNIDTGVLQDIKKKFEEEAKKGADDKYLRTFKKNDYIERERAIMESKIITSWPEDNIEEAQKKHQEQYQANLKLKESLTDAFKYHDEIIAQKKQQKEKEYQEQVQKFKAELTQKFKQQILDKGLQLQKQDEERKLREEEARKKEQEEREKKQIAQQAEKQPVTETKFISRSNISSQALQQQQQPNQQAPQQSAPQTQIGRNNLGFSNSRSQTETQQSKPVQQFTRSTAQSGQQQQQEQPQQQPQQASQQQQQQQQQRQTQQSTNPSAQKFQRSK
ncbi:unnamed protein product [Paramecium octaurelia]|uniref:PCI domain-containing protein n=1 Tax=Paramecium octaurelia TaxID=43137 RepID=A0A8S1TK01_PAROT|nr:unnamed protein product [Paramecium octaurelia]